MSKFDQIAYNRNGNRGRKLKDSAGFTASAKTRGVGTISGPQGYTLGAPHLSPFSSFQGAPIRLNSVTGPLNRLQSHPFSAHSKSRTTEGDRREKTELPDNM